MRHLTPRLDRLRALIERHERPDARTAIDGVHVASIDTDETHTRPTGTVFALIAGLLFGALVLYTGNLLAATIGHVIVNAVNLSRLARRSREPSGGEATPAT